MPLQNYYLFQTRLQYFQTLHSNMDSCNLGGAISRTEKMRANVMMRRILAYSSYTVIPIMYFRCSEALRGRIRHIMKKYLHLTQTCGFVAASMAANAMQAHISAHYSWGKLAPLNFQPELYKA